MCTYINSTHSRKSKLHARSKCKNNHQLCKPIKNGMANSSSGMTFDGMKFCTMT